MVDKYKVTQIVLSSNTLNLSSNTLNMHEKVLIKSGTILKAIKEVSIRLNIKLQDAKALVDAYKYGIGRCT